MTDLEDHDPIPFDPELEAVVPGTHPILSRECAAECFDAAHHGPGLQSPEELMHT